MMELTFGDLYSQYLVSVSRLCVSILNIYVVEDKVVWTSRSLS
jgi:hypothetical protein